MTQPTETTEVDLPLEVEPIEVAPAEAASEPAPAAPLKDEWAAPATNEPHPWSLHLQSMLLAVPHSYQAGVAGLTEESLPLLLKETQGRFREAPGQRIERPETKTDDDLLAIGSGAVPCPICGSRGYTGEVERLYIGKQTGVQITLPASCYCLVFRRYTDRWLNPANVPLDYRDCTWSNFRDDTLRGRFRLNDSAYRLLKTAIVTYPKYNMLLVGPAGAGKTTLMTVLYDYALKIWATDSFLNNTTTEAVWKQSATRLMAEHIAYVNRPREEDAVGPPVPLPVVMVEKVLNALKPSNRLRPHISISEFDKYKLSSEFQNNVLHEIMNEVQPQGGQMVCDSNLGLAKLAARIGEQHGPPMLRRLTGGPRGLYFDFWAGKLYINNVRHTLNKNGELTANERDRLDLWIPDKDPNEAFTAKTYSPSANAAKNAAPTSTYVRSNQRSSGQLPTRPTLAALCNGLPNPKRGFANTRELD